MPDNVRTAETVLEEARNYSIGSPERRNLLLEAEILLIMGK